MYVGGRGAVWVYAIYFAMLTHPHTVMPQPMTLTHPTIPMLHPMTVIDDSDSSTHSPRV